jgi:hypothetical protein
MATIPYVDPGFAMFSQDRPNSAGKIAIASLSDGILQDIDHSITRVSVDYSMEEASQLSFDVIETMSTS